MSQELKIQPLTKESFAGFGQVIETKDAETQTINQGKCQRFHDLAKVETTGPGARTLINIFRAKPYSLPYGVSMVEKHPFGSQAFIPLGASEWLVVVAAEREDGPTGLKAFLPSRGQGVSYNRNTWHAVLTPLDQEADFLVVDRGGEGLNLVEHFFDQPFLINREAVAACKAARKPVLVKT